MARWEVQLFGSLRIQRGEEVVTRFRTRATESVFAYLALHLGKEVPRSQLIAIAWPDADEESGRRNLRTALSDLRQRLGAAAVRADRVTAWLEPTAFDVDVERFLATRDPRDCPGRLLEGFTDAWILPFSIEVDDAYARAVIARMEVASVEEAEALAAECLRREPGRLDVRAKLRDLGLGAETRAGPSATSSFIGRERELAEILELVASHRLVTLTGLGGSGKTRLAGEIWSRRTPEAWFVPLADINDGTQVAEAARTRLRLPMSTQRTALEQVVHGLESSDGLLVLDNFEHVISGKDTVSRLLQGCPNLHVLVTSQVPLGLPEEIEYPVGPLALVGSPGEPHSDAVLLFEARAKAVCPSFSLSGENLADVRHLCGKLDGFPLALEIAAAKSRVFTPGEMVVQLEDRFAFLTKGGERQHAKHGSLRTALDWSFERLADAEQTLLTELTVFRGGFTLKAVADVTSQPRPDTLIDNLLVHSWIERVPASHPQRFRMLESIREFCSELLPPRRREELSRAHAAHYLHLARSCFDEAFQAAEPEVHRLVDLEIHNLDAAWLWLRSHDPQGNLNLIVYLNWHSVLRGQVQVAEARIKEALAQVAREDADLLSDAYRCCGNFLTFQGRFMDARPWFERSEAAARERNDAFNEGLACLQLAWLHAEFGEFQAAEERVSRAISLQALTENANWIGSAYCVATLIANRRGDVKRAQELGEISLAYCRMGGYPWGLASVLNELAYANRVAGDLDLALAQESESIAIKRRHYAPRSLALSLAGQAGILLDLGRVHEAKESLQEALTLLLSLGDTASMPSIYEVASKLAGHLGDRVLYEQAQMVEGCLRLSVGTRAFSSVASSSRPAPFGSANHSGLEPAVLDSCIQAILAL